MRVIAFDFDGTLAESHRLFAEVYNDFAARLGYRPIRPEERYELMKLNLRERSERLGVPMARLPLLMAAVAIRYKQLDDRVRLFTGMSTLVRRLSAAGLPLYVVSTKRPRSIRTVLERDGLDRCFRRIFCGRKVLGKKRLLRRFLRAEHLRPSDLIYVGDEQEDAEACRSLGVEFVAVTWGRASEDELRARSPAHLVTRREELAELLLGDAGSAHWPAAELSPPPAQ